MDDCLFCRIARGELPSAQAYADERVIAIEDLHPQAPVHLLVLPRVHFDDIGALADAADAALTRQVFAVASRLGRERGGPGGYRLVTNTGVDAGQSVGHLHVHVLAGRALGWPPG